MLLLPNAPYRGLKRVIDVSGDGSNNRGRDVREARDEAVRAGVIINGLPIVSLEYDLDKYYFNNVIGGPGSFIVPADSYDNFAQAVLRKLVLEIASIDWHPRPPQRPSAPLVSRCLNLRPMSSQSSSVFSPTAWMPCTPVPRRCPRCRR